MAQRHTHAFVRALSHQPPKVQKKVCYFAVGDSTDEHRQRTLDALQAEGRRTDSADAHTARRAVRWMKEDIARDRELRKQSG